MKCAEVLKYLFQVGAERLPPTMSAIKFKVFRTHYVTLTLKRAHQPFQLLPEATGYGWEQDNDELVAIMTDSLPAPLALVELSACGCKTECSNGRCLCYKNNLVCTDMCKCSDCKNCDETESNGLPDWDSDDDDYI